MARPRMAEHSIDWQCSRQGVQGSPRGQGLEAGWRGGSHQWYSTLLLDFWPSIWEGEIHHRRQQHGGEAKRKDWGDFEHVFGVC